MTQHSSIAIHDGTAVITLAGELDLATGEELQTLLRQAIGNPMTRRVTVDLTRVTFIGSTALGALVGLRHELTGFGIGLQLLGPSRQFLRLLEITGMHEFFEIAGDPSDAVS